MSTAASQVLCRLTGPAHIQAPASLDTPVARPTEDVHLDGADLGVPFPWGESWRLVFGDTDTNPERGDLYHQQDPGVWGPVEPNALASVAPPLGPDCPASVRWYVRDGRVASVLPLEPGEVSVIISGAVTVGDRVYVHAMSVGEWGDGCNPPGIHGTYCVRYGFIARSRDGGEHFDRLPTVRWSLPQHTYAPGHTYTDAGFAESALALGPGPEGAPVMWLLGAQAGRRGPLRLAWVPTTRIEDPTAYRYFSGIDNGMPRWGGDAEYTVPILPAPVGECSVAWVPVLGRWVLLHLDVRARAIVAVTARALIGPWSAPVRVLDCRSLPWAGCYGGYTYGTQPPGPRFGSADGAWLYFTVSSWATYETYLARVPTRELLAPGAR